MRTVLLTTDTPHHTYFAWRLHERGHLTAVVLETRVPAPPFKTFHPFERLRDEYERMELLAGFGASIADLCETRRVERIDGAAEPVRALAPDVILVFGTTRLPPELIEAPRTACLNLHGGNPEEYRGLDTHLWAIYHRDFENLVTTLHHVDLGLDTGDVVSSERVPLEPGMPLHHLRAANARVCVELSLRALGDLERGTLPARKQRRRGRFYSFMPAVLKDVCVHQFERYTAAL